MLTLQVHDHSQEPIFVDMASPEVGANQILIRTAACALNFADLLMIKGTYQETPTLPFTLGMEVAGDVAAVGSKVTNFKVGDILKAAGYRAPALNKARGNIFESYSVAWTGPHYIAGYSAGGQRAPEGFTGLNRGNSRTIKASS